MRSLTVSQIFRSTSVWSEIFHTTGASLFAIVTTAGIVAVTARALGPEGRGVYAAATSWVLLFVSLGSLSLGYVIVSEVAGQPPERWLKQIAGTLITVAAIIVCIAFAVLSLTYVLSGGQIYSHLSVAVLAISFAALPFTLFNEQVRSVLNVIGEIRVYNVGTVVAYSVGLATTIILLLIVHTDVTGALVAFVLSAALISAVSVVRLSQVAGGFQLSWPLALRLILSGLKLHPNAVGSFLFAQSSVLILNYFRPLNETAYYQLALQIFGTLLLMPNAIGTAGFRLVGQRGPDLAWAQQRGLLLRGLLITLAAIVAGYVLAPTAIVLIAGPDFAPAADLLRIVLPALFGATCSSVMASQWIGRGLFWQASALTLGVGLISLALDLAFIPTYGMYGALISTLVTYGISVVGNGSMAIWVELRTRTQRAPAPVR